MELEKMESEAEEVNLGDYYSPTDDSIGDGARRDQPAPAATMAPQPIFDEEIMENTVQRIRRHPVWQQQGELRKFRPAKQRCRIRGASR